ncbi:MAG TPA: WG repeat-containing protein [Terriglobales bacterium]|nr:WG repeat-containing protein [Terriglobales bacterium]
MTRVTPEFDGACDFHEGLAAVLVEKNVGYIRSDGSFALLSPHQSASGIDFAEGLAAVRVNGKVGFMDKSGNVVIEPAYYHAYPFSDGVAPVQLRGKWGYVDRNGNRIIAIQYDRAHMFSEVVASVERGGKWGYIDRSGRYQSGPRSMLRRRSVVASRRLKHSKRLERQAVAAWLTFTEVTRNDRLRPGITCGATRRSERGLRLSAFETTAS